MRASWPVLAFVVAAAAPPGRAQPSQLPALAPQRDVAVTYRVTSAGVQVQTREFVQATTGRIRNENAGGVMIRDRHARRTWFWDGDAPARVVTEREVAEDEQELTYDEIGRDPDFELRRLGAQTVAGVPCTEWRIRLKEEADAQAMTVCLSADGLALRQHVTQSGMTSTSEAVRVEYGPLDPALFAPPPGWTVRRMAPGP